MSRIKTYLVGRDSDCDYQIADTSVSRRHAEVVLAPDGRFFVTDRDSTGGTFVLAGRDWEPVRQAYVEPPARIRFGGYEMEVARLAVLWGPGAAGPAPAGRPAPERAKEPMRNPETGEVLDRESP